MNISVLPLWTPVASTLLAMAWLLPNANPPWVAFHKDSWAAFTILLVGIVLLIKKRLMREALSLDILSSFLLVLSVATVAQWMFGLVSFSGHALVGSAYFLAAAFVVLIGKAWELAEPGKVGEFIFTSFFLGAMGTSLLMLVQWFRFDISTIWINELPLGGRPYGNLVQPNNASTLLLWGLVSVFWFCMRVGANKVIWILFATYLSFCVALTGSRIGSLSFVLLLMWSVYLGCRSKLMREWRWVFICLLILFPLFVLTVSIDWGQQQASGVAINPLNRDLTSLRMLAYKTFLIAASQKPWLGYGFGQGAEAQLAAGALGHELPYLFTWTHNIFLDILIWFGSVFALVAIAVALYVFRAVISAQFRVASAAYFACIFVLLMHAMVELPHTYAYFLIPVGLIAGALIGHLNLPKLSLSIKVVIAPLMILAFLLGLIAVDYFRIESSFNSWRFKQARVGKDHPADIPRTMVLNQFEALIVGLRGSSENLNNRQMAQFDDAVTLFPSAAAMQQLAELYLRRGEVDRAQMTADRGRLLASASERRALVARWEYLGTQEPMFKLVKWRD